MLLFAQNIRFGFVSTEAEILILLLLLLFYYFIISIIIKVFVKFVR